MDAEAEALVWVEVNVDVFLSLRSSGNVFPLADCIGCGFYEDRIAAQDFHSGYIPVGEHRDVQANQASDVSVFQALGIFGLDTPQDLPACFLNRLSAGRGERQESEK